MFTLIYPTKSLIETGAAYTRFTLSHVEGLMLKRNEMKRVTIGMRKLPL